MDSFMMLGLHLAFAHFDQTLKEEMEFLIPPTEILCL